MGSIYLPLFPQHWFSLCCPLVPVSLVDDGWLSWTSHSCQNVFLPPSSSCPRRSTLDSPTTGSVINGLTSSRHKQSIFFLKPSRKHLGNKTQNYCVSNASVMCYYKKHLLSVEKIKYLFACTGGITVRNVPRVRTPGAETPWDPAITPSMHTAFLPYVSQVSKWSVSSWTAHIGQQHT